MKYDKVHQMYNKFLALPDVDPTLVSCLTAFCAHIQSHGVLLDLNCRICERERRYDGTKPLGKPTESFRLCGLVENFHRKMFFVHSIKPTTTKFAAQFTTFIDAFLHRPTFNT